MTITTAHSGDRTIKLAPLACPTVSADFTPTISR